MYSFRPPLLYLSLRPFVQLSRMLMFQISTNAPAVLVEMRQHALTLSTRTRVAVSLVSREHTANLVSV